MAANIISTRKSEGPTVERGDLLVTPISTAFIIRFPFGAFILNRPTAVKVVHGNKEDMIPVIDATRIALLALMAMSIIFWFISWRVSREKSKN